VSVFISAKFFDRLDVAELLKPAAPAKPAAPVVVVTKRRYVAASK
jgi:hypothetical protein